MSDTAIPQIGDTKKGHVFTENGWVPTKPPKKKRTFLKVFLALCAFGVVCIIGLIALLSAAFNGASDAIDKAEANNKPHVVAEGAAFTHDGYSVAQGWKVTGDGFGGVTIKGLKVTNVSHSATEDTPMFTFTLWQGKQNMAEIQADGKTLAKGQSSTMDAVSLDDTHGVPHYQTVKVADMW